LRGSVHTVGHLSSESRSWLMANAAVVLYPSSAEGFGFVPYEAAALGTPSTFILFGPLAELSGVRDAPSRWSVDEVTADLTRLLTQEDAAAGRVAGLQRARTELTWERFAERLAAFFGETLARPAVVSGLEGNEFSTVWESRPKRRRLFRAVRRVRRS